MILRIPYAFVVGAVVAFPAAHAASPSPLATTNFAGYTFIDSACVAP